ncbi:MAG: 2-oxoglutarate dehydrogenase complex dihydrolipoyllysine-residue succinyltransferase [Acidobacteria bacterium]|nr:2-oxoglutarate dehydrogenase complex dihydrolipoyllysine-residue succinyltransferase [Acidobacteriota bacterium]
MSVSIVVPEMGESVVDARVRRWLKQPGDAVTVGEPLVELETDKVDVEVSASKTGVLATIVHAEGADVKIGDTLGTIDESAAKGSEAPKSKNSDQPKKAEPSKEPAAAAKPVAATPSARREAREKDVPLAAVKSDGPRVTRDDVRKSAPGGPRTEDRGPRTVVRERMSKRRATIAKRLVEVQATAALLTTFNEVDMSAVMALRERQKQSFKDKHGVGLGFSSFFVKATIAALREFPRLNAEIEGDEMVLKSYYDIGIAVGAAEGLVVPVLRDADRMGFADIEARIRDFAGRAKENTLTLDDLRGGSFTITNGGVFGSLMSTPILNPPQVGILGLHAIKERPVGVDGQVVLRPMMYTALTYDHRIVDGAEAVRFLVRIKELIEDPGVLLIES